VKVERMIRKLNQEFVYHLRRFPEWLDGRIAEFREWYNHSRFIGERTYLQGFMV